uniref:NADH-ubiquinone oxidoreductase chain 4L n=1 Tax=Speleketor irwini TaxID=342007 RepID=A0A343QCI3_9NEOP|nr:NADH dehydrogenase subunit 4L [Speleketor irwini]ATU07130.1 NADH dehydrogenase subunit 4L [Speleketor irwini]
MLKEMGLILSVMVCLGGLSSFVYNRLHLLVMLISLEFISLGIFMFMSIYLNVLSMDLYFLMVFLTFVVCEGALGVSLLVSMIRSYGSDYMQLLDFLKC